MGAVVSSRGDTVITSLLAAIKAAIDASSDWSNITGDVMKATASNGAQLVVDLNDAAIAAHRMTVAAYRSHNGSVGTDKAARFIPWRRTTGGATSDTVHWFVSAGPDHVYIEIEGPRGGETNAETVGNGSFRGSLFLGGITPYFTTTYDNVPSAVLVAFDGLASASQTQPVAVSRNAADNASWVTAYLETLSTTGYTGWDASGASFGIGQPVALDGIFTKDLIFKEKYIAMFLQPEAWVDARRFDYQYKDFTLPENALLTTFIRRSNYPSSETDRNAKNAPVVTSLADKLWFDQP